MHEGRGTNKDIHGKGKTWTGHNSEGHQERQKKKEMENTEIGAEEQTRKLVHIKTVRCKNLWTGNRREGTHTDK